MVQLRKEIVTEAKKQNIKFSYMPLMLKAASLALLDFPMLNASVNKDATEITYYASHNIGIAMDTAKGLVVPVIKDIQNKSIMEIAQDINRLQAAASENKLTEADLQGGTFTLSNIGSIGGTYMTPVLVVPQVCIGALGKFQIMPKYVKSDGSAGEPSMDDILSGAAVAKPSTIMNISWSADHRVVDGATMARFSNQWKKYIEAPNMMLTKML
jgi:2-oxoisovalerate dehydrogenase E2 component (dihydrolipoyl transacylase)